MTVIFDPGEFDRFFLREFTLRARRALQIYRKVPLRRDAPGYPFAQRPEDSSIRRASASSVKPIPNGVRITVQSRGAPFLERGNDRGGAYIVPRDKKALALPLKGSAPGARRAKSRGGRAGRVVIGPDGRPYLMQQRVRTYRGRRQLERSVAYAFTGRSGLRGGPL